MHVLMLGALGASLTVVVTMAFQAQSLLSLSGKGDGGGGRVDGMIQPVSVVGPLRVHPSNPRYFTDGSGKAIYLTGSHTWSNFKDDGPTDPPPSFDYIGYLDFLQEHNHNFIRLWTWELTKYAYDGTFGYADPFPWPRTGPGRALDGKPKFDLSRFN